MNVGSISVPVHDNFGARRAAGLEGLALVWLFLALAQAVVVLAQSMLVSHLSGACGTAWYRMLPCLAQCLVYVVW